MAITRLTGVDNSTLAWATIAPAAGDLVLLFFSNDGGDNQTGLANFTRLGVNLAATVELGIYYRICTGAESGNVFTDETAFGISGEEYTWHAIKIPAAEWHGTTVPEIGIPFTEPSGTPDTPGLSPSWGAEVGTVFVVVCCRDDDDGMPAGPTGYATNYVRTAGGIQGPELGTSWRIPSPAVTTEDPGTWSVTGTNEQYISNIVAVRPTAGPAEETLSFGLTAAVTAVAAADLAVVVPSQAAAFNNVTDSETFAAPSNFEAVAVTFVETEIAEIGVSLTEAAAFGYSTSSEQFAFGPTPFAAVNTDATLDVDTTYLLRVRVENTGIAGATNFRWSYDHAGMGWLPVTATSTEIKAVPASSFVNGQDVPEVLGGSGTYLADNNAGSEDGLTTLSVAFPANGAVEFVLAFQLVGVDVSSLQTGQIRLELDDGPGTDLNAYDFTLTYMVGEIVIPGPFYTQTAFRVYQDDGTELGPPL